MNVRGLVALSKNALLTPYTFTRRELLSHDVAIKIIMKLHKQRMETYAVYVAQNREDLAKDELFEAQVMEVYLPKMMSEEEVRQEVLVAIAQTGAKSPKEIGKIMGVLSGKLAGKADGKLIASIVKEELLNP